MNPRTILTVADGRSIDLLNPTAADYMPLDWAAEHLAKENRYNGATPEVTYSVAVHTNVCIDLALAKFDRTVAAYAALHDVPEAVLKDDTTPKKNAFAALAQAKFGVLAPQILGVFDDLTERHDRAVHEAAGLSWPPSPEMQAAIKWIDRTALVTEWRDLMGVPLPNAAAYSDVEPMIIHIAPVSWRAAAEGLRRRWRQVLPVYQSQAA